MYHGEGEGRRGEWIDGERKCMNREEQCGFRKREEGSVDQLGPLKGVI